MASNKKVITIPYHPRPFQKRLHNSLRRFNVVVAHRRFGKTWFALSEMIDRAFRNPLRNPQYAYIAPNYGQAKRVAWDILKDFLKVFGKSVEFFERELRADVTLGDKRYRFILMSAENPDAARGMYLDGAVLDEFADQPKEMWTKIVRPMLSDRNGWVIFISTPKGRNAFWEVYDYAKNQMLEDPNSSWFCALYTIEDTKILPEEEIAQLKKDMLDEEFRQEYMCDFDVALANAIYSKEIAQAHEEGRITNVPYDQNVPVSLSFDIGMDDATAVWFWQIAGKEIHFIDYYETQGKGFPEIVKDLKAYPYVYDFVYLPHDAKVRELGTGLSRLESFENLNLVKRGNVIVVDKVDPIDGIHLVKKIFNKFWFDERRCYKGLDLLKMYQREFDPMKGVYKKQPKHDKSSHAADSLRYFAVAYYRHLRTIRQEDRILEVETDYDIWSV
ncbi:hypothetical protein D6745_03195 [Candidatus Woesearchaeota archaeon]|nr:MAG: hypothetical protein D6745_03195 [Candidatus Woesearchaeota archaeon]